MAPVERSAGQPASVPGTGRSALMCPDAGMRIPNQAARSTVVVTAKSMTPNLHHRRALGACPLALALFAASAACAFVAPIAAARSPYPAGATREAFVARPSQLR